MTQSEDTGSSQSRSKQNRKKKMEWHNLLGIGLTDYFFELAYKVDTEIDLSLKQQRLDIVVIEKDEGKPIEEVFDGFENLIVPLLRVGKQRFIINLLSA